MSDDESREEETQPEPEEEKHVPHQSHHEESVSQSKPASQADSNEARKAMEEAKERKREKMEQELAEFEEMRKEEREKELEELEALRIKREQRKLERLKEEERLFELSKIEEKRQRAEQEERKKKKAEEEQKKKEQREKKRKEAEARMAFTKDKGARNFVINKREGDGVDLDRVQSDEPYQKSREELEEEKRAVLAQRITPLSLEGMNQDKLLEKARQLHEKLRSLEGDKYDLEQRFKRQQYDMIELAERARQMNKGKSKRSAVQVDESFDRLSDKYTSAPPKIQLCSKYEKLTDRRTFGQRAELFEELSKEVPPPEIKRIRPATTDGEEEAAEAEGEAAE